MKHDANLIITKKEIAGTLYLVESVSEEKAVPAMESKLKRLILRNINKSENTKIG